MTATDHPLRSEFIDAVDIFNQGSSSDATAHFSSEAVFIVPGHSALAGTYRGREGVAEFFEGLHRLGGDSFTVTPVEVLANDEHLVLFLRFTAERDDERLDVTVAGFHSDRRPDGWGKSTCLPDDLVAFDQFFRAS
jgi:ketosteroid isomerase-like protein